MDFNSIKTQRPHFKENSLEQINKKVKRSFEHGKLLQIRFLDGLQLWQWNTENNKNRREKTNLRKEIEIDQGYKKKSRQWNKAS